MKTNAVPITQYIDNYCGKIFLVWTIPNQLDFAGKNQIVY